MVISHLQWVCNIYFAVSRWMGEVLLKIPEDFK